MSFPAPTAETFDVIFHFPERLLPFGAVNLVARRCAEPEVEHLVVGRRRERRTAAGPRRDWKIRSITPVFGLPCRPSPQKT